MEERQTLARTATGSIWRPPRERRGSKEGQGHRRSRHCVGGFLEYSVSEVFDLESTEKNSCLANQGFPRISAISTQRRDGR